MNSNCWHWVYEGYGDQEHAEILPLGFEIPEESNLFLRGHKQFGDSILFFTSLWPRFYVECVLPQQIDEPANAEEFWENLNLSVPVVPEWDRIAVPYFEDNSKRWFMWWKVEIDNDLRRKIDRIFNQCDNDPQYRWTFGNAIIRAVKAWRGEAE